MLIRDSVEGFKPNSLFLKNLLFAIGTCSVATTWRPAITCKVPGDATNDLRWPHTFYITGDRINGRSKSHLFLANSSYPTPTMAGFKSDLGNALRLAL